MSPEVLKVVAPIAELAVDGTQITLAEEVVAMAEEEGGVDTDEVEDAEDAFNVEGGAVVVVAAAEACLGTMISRMIRLKFWGNTQRRPSTLL